MNTVLIELFKPMILALAAGLVGLIAAYVRKKLKTQNQKELLDTVEGFMLEGMAQAQEQIVRPAKQKGGKLDAETVKKAEETAYAFAKTVAKGKALDLLQGLSQSRVKSMIKQLL